MNILAEIAPDWISILTQTGLAGVVLAWFMYRTETRLQKVENANDRMARANLLLVVSLHQANDAAKAEARLIIQEIDDVKARASKEK